MKMLYEGPDNATLLILSHGCLDEAVCAALRACAEPLGHSRAVAFFDVSQSRDVSLAVHSVDPWCVVAVDDESARSLKDSFASCAEGFAPDMPANAHGYQLVWVPAFKDCLGNQEKKRVAWNRLKAAQHPGAPY